MSLSQEIDRSDWSFDDFIREGTQLSWLAQETEASSSGNKFIAVDVHDHFMIWYLELKRFLSLKGYFNNKHSDYLKVAPLLDAGNVSCLKGGTEYGNPESLKSQRLLKNIRKEITDILKLLRQISSEADKRAQSKPNVKNDQLDFDPERARLYVKGYEIKIQKFSDQYHLLRIIFENPQETPQEWFFSDIAERTDNYKC